MAKSIIMMALLLHDADDANQRDDAEFSVAGEQCQQRTYARRGQCGQNGQRMDITFVKYAQHDVHRTKCRPKSWRLSSEP